MVSKAIEVTKEVNMWVEKETDGLIKEVLSPGSVDTETRLIFANAMYFKGTWNEKFDALKTKEYDFHLLDGNSVKVPFITSMHDQFISVFDGFKVLGLHYKQGNGFISDFDAIRKVLGLPYKQDKDKRQFSMYFFLPDTKDGLSFLIKKLASESKFLERKFPSQKVKVGNFRIPKFKISFELETSNVLKELGVVLPFYPGSLTKMVESPASQDLYVNEIFHKSFIEVNEEGTEAAATTVGEMVGCSLNDFTPPKIDFVADHPFLFLIREDFSGKILVIGQVLNPLVEKL
jgi:serpin B